jgi:hypothetical protein
MKLLPKNADYHRDKFFGQQAGPTREGAEHRLSSQWLAPRADVRTVLRLGPGAGGGRAPIVWATLKRRPPARNVCTRRILLVQDRRSPPTSR